MFDFESWHKLTANMLTELCNPFECKRTLLIYIGCLLGHLNA